MTLGACVADDVKYLLQENKKTVNGMTVTVEGEWAQNPPARFSRLQLKFDVDSPDASKSDVNRVADVVIDSISALSNTLKGKPKLTAKAVKL
jgi:uncharacterized OsmC-like protein